jgi:pimeloyl-ACP methyl ester carboxylesterase
MAMKMIAATQPPACIAITPAAPAGVLPRPSRLLLRFLLAAMPSIVFGRDFFPCALLREIALGSLDPPQQDDALKKMRPVPASQVRVIVPSLVGLDRQRLNSPLLIVGATEDRLTPVTQTRAIARRYGADYHEYPGASHYILLEKACSDMTLDMISWLEEQPPGRKVSSAQDK